MRRGQVLLVLIATFVGFISAKPADVCVHDIVTRGYNPTIPRINPLKLRYLNSKNYQWRPLNVKFDYSGIEGLPKHAKEFLINDLIPKVGKLFSSYLQVKYIPGEKWAMTSLTCHKTNISARYKTPVIEADLLIFVTYSNNSNDTFRAWAAACELDSRTKRAKAGQINFNWETLNESMTVEEFKPIFHTTLHELTHVLGLSKTQYSRYLDENGNPLGVENVIQKSVERGFNTSLIILPKVRDYVRKYFNCSSVQGAELENQGESGSLGSHWERRIFTNEFMTAASRKDQKISNLTLALLDSTGWYKVDYSVAGELTFGKSAGCNFLLLRCYMNGKPRYHGWCPNATGKTEGCDFKNQAKSICSLRANGSLYDDDNKNKTLPEAFDYFNGLLAHDHFNDNCPYYRPFSDGHCGLTKNHKEAKFGWLYDETFGPGSRCFEGDYYKTTARFKGEADNHGTCHRYRCQKDKYGQRQVVILIGKGASFTEVVCPPHGGNTSIPGYRGGVKCPVGEDFCRDEEANTCPHKNHCNEIGHCYRGQCICPPGHNSETCEEPTIDCKKSKCSNRGTCRKNSCECFEGWGGPECEHPRVTIGCQMCRMGRGLCYGGLCLDSLSELSTFFQETNITLVATA